MVKGWVAIISISLIPYRTHFTYIPLLAPWAPWVHYSLPFLQLCLLFITRVGALGCVCMFYLNSLVNFNSLIYFHFSCYHPFTIPLLLCFIIVHFSSTYVFCLSLLRLILFISLVDDFSHFLVHQVSHVTPFIPPVDFDLDTLAWEVTSRLGLYIHVSDWSWHDFGVCV